MTDHERFERMADLWIEMGGDADGMLYYTSGKKGGGMLALSEDGSEATLRWTDETLDCSYQGVVVVDGYVYGC